MEKHEGNRTAQLVQVIRVHAVKGIGTREDPVKSVYEYWTQDGGFLCEIPQYVFDPNRGKTEEQWQEEWIRKHRKPGSCTGNKFEMTF